MPGLGRLAAVAALLGMHVGMGRCLFLEIFPADSVCFLLLFLPFSGRGSGPGREPQDGRDHGGGWQPQLSRLLQWLA